MTDHIARVLEQAEKEAERLFNDRDDDMAACCPDVQYGFIRGAEWVAERLTRENVTKAVFPFFEYMDAEDEKTIDRVMELIASGVVTSEPSGNSEEFD